MNFNTAFVVLCVFILFDLSTKNAKGEQQLFPEKTPSMQEIIQLLNHTKEEENLNTNDRNPVGISTSGFDRMSSDERFTAVSSNYILTFLRLSEKVRPKAKSHEKIHKRNIILDLSDKVDRYSKELPSHIFRKFLTKIRSTKRENINDRIKFIRNRIALNRNLTKHDNKRVLYIQYMIHTDVKDMESFGKRGINKNNSEKWPSTKRSKSAHFMKKTIMPNQYKYNAKHFKLISERSPRKLQYFNAFITHNTYPSYSLSRNLHVASNSPVKSSRITVNRNTINDNYVSSTQSSTNAKLDKSELSKTTVAGIIPFIKNNTTMSNQYKYTAKPSKLISERSPRKLQYFNAFITHNMYPSYSLSTNLQVASNSPVKSSSITVNGSTINDNYVSSTESSMDAKLDKSKLSKTAVAAIISGIIAFIGFTGAAIFTCSKNNFLRNEERQALIN